MVCNQRGFDAGRTRLLAGSSLARLLAEHGKKRNHCALPPLSRKKILAWADAHREYTGRWPNVNSGVVTKAPSERWDLIDNALRQGLCGLPGGSSLLQLIVKKRGVRNPLALPTLTETEVRRWAKLHRDLTGSLPSYRSGPIGGTNGETWASVDLAFRRGQEFEGAIVPAADVHAAFMAAIRFGYARLVFTDEYLTGGPSVLTNE